MRFIKVAKVLLSMNFNSVLSGRHYILLGISIQMYTYIHTCTKHTCINIYTYINIHLYYYTCIYVYVNTCSMHTYMYTHIHTCILHTQIPHAYINTYIQIHMHVCTLKRNPYNWALPRKRQCLPRNPHQSRRAANSPCYHHSGGPEISNHSQQ